MIVNVIPFLGEFELLKVRLEYLKGIVDKFIIFEADMTYSGQCKPMFFHEASQYGWDFSQYNIIYNPITDSPLGCDPWIREEHQRTRVYSKLRDMKADLVLMTDADEIPTHSAIDACLRSNSAKFTFHMEYLKFYVNMQDIRMGWNKVMAFKPNLTPMERYDRGNFQYSEDVTGAGWHFDYMGGKDRLLYKIGATSHYKEIGAKNFWHEIYSGTHDWLAYCRPYDYRLLPGEASFLLSNPIFYYTPENDWVTKKLNLCPYRS